ncbi:bifunctional enoyl-CoA hydratase/phosphate acetyltransferase [Aeoliella sp. ICT_H6.2]|uniref:Bifunctional enoyl-CoA hydratase/phosphate acetyltransferase n=1 Tax=Aeoliella straminimaris TaxID=2954799 RepID=A0A9X2JI32_9BACT|nr:bifunctional enoyl-CoA hydratase/phosphate acetyltransferase [Aeoliella straminimaris]MCO6045238.1 bifunctional enoyl-CoA hydratase/phosphate acetyltransferase [Aeoliella straminimaris]
MDGKKELVNVTFDELKIGQSASLTRTLTRQDIQLFAILSGDVNPAHLDESFAEDSIFRGVVGHGMWTGSLISALLGTALPGPGTIYLNEELAFKKPVRPGETIRVEVSVKEKHPEKHIVLFESRCTNALGETVATGTSTVIAPDRKIRRRRPELPDVQFHFHDRFRDLIDRCEQLPRIKAAIIHPVSTVAIQAMAAAVNECLIDPVLIGPADRIRQAASAAEVDIDRFEIVSTEHSHAAARLAAEMAANGSVSAMMKGSLSTDELMSVLAPPSVGLRTEHHVSHVYVVDVSSYHKLLLITDAAINISPTLSEKADICRNAIALWRVMAGEDVHPKVAILAATEKVRPNMQATVDAACLCKMADRHQIKHAHIDGPLALDLAINREVVQQKGITSKVAGDADILVAPDINSGNMVAKQLTFLGHAAAAGLVLGARVPIILTSRSDTKRARLMSWALAVLVSEARRQGQLK